MNEGIFRTPAPARNPRGNNQGCVSETRSRRRDRRVFTGAAGELNKALAIVNKQLVAYETQQDSTSSMHYFYIPMLGTRAAINYELGITGPQPRPFAAYSVGQRGKI